MTSRVSESQKNDSTKSNARKQESTNLISENVLWSRLRRGADARVRFVESHLSKNLAFQIRGMRDREEWSQQELAGKAEMTQNAISRLENPFYGKATITTLKRIAAVFDVALVVRFVPFSYLTKWVTGTPYEEHGLSMESSVIPSFAQEDQVVLGKIPDDINVTSHEVTIRLGLIPSPKSIGSSAAFELNRRVAGGD